MSEPLASVPAFTRVGGTTAVPSVVWENPPAAGSVLDHTQLRAIALQLLDTADRLVRETEAEDDNWRVV